MFGKLLFLKHIRNCVSSILDKDSSCFHSSWYGFSSIFRFFSLILLSPIVRYWKWNLLKISVMRFIRSSTTKKWSSQWTNEIFLDDEWLLVLLKSLAIGETIFFPLLKKKIFNFFKWVVSDWESEMILIYKWNEMKLVVCFSNCFAVGKLSFGVDGCCVYGCVHFIVQYGYQA